MYSFVTVAHCSTFLFYSNPAYEKEHCYVTLERHWGKENSANTVYLLELLLRRSNVICIHIFGISKSPGKTCHQCTEVFDTFSSWE